ncbi:MAG: transcriptional regulator [Flaviaesturariibacter sp.]|nr:transcriptional regulator [Flaviaesturariibacter sp.]
MNLQQLEYIVALDTHRHFAKAAESCFITQATLSMMVKKLEDELGISLFDRSRQPVVPTEAGSAIIEQARVVVKEAAQVKLLSEEIRTGVGGELRIGIIPTLAPYLLPLFLAQFLAAYPAIRLKIVEQTTDQLLRMLASDTIDVGIMATPLQRRNYKETHLFYEEFRVFVSGDDKGLRKKYILPKDLDVNRLWLLEEGHCLRTQTLNLCELQEQQARAHHLDYETGSIESLLKITEMNGGITIIPELAALSFAPEAAAKLRAFKPPAPVREISLVTYRHFVKKGLLTLLETSITTAVRPLLAKRKDPRVVGL